MAVSDLPPLLSVTDEDGFQKKRAQVGLVSFLAFCFPNRYEDARGSFGSLESTL